MESKRARELNFAAEDLTVVAEEEGIRGYEALPVALEGTLEGI